MRRAGPAKFACIRFALLAVLFIALFSQHAVAQQTWELGQGAPPVAWPGSVQNAPTQAPPAIAPAGAYPWMGQTYDPIYVTPLSAEQSTFDPFGWGSRYDVVPEPPAPPQLPAMPTAEQNVKSRNGMFYGRADAMIFRREGGNTVKPIIIDLDPFTGLPTGNEITTSGLASFLFQVGQRGTIGYQFNRGPSVEFTYFAVQNWQSSQTINSSSPFGNSLFFTSDGMTPADLSLISNDYNGAETMTVTASSQFKSLELNVFTPTIYDRLQLLLGLRSIDFNDNLDIRSTNADTNSTSDYTIATSNFMRGGQFGGMYRRDFDLIGLEFTGKVGIYNNYVKQANFVGDQNNTPPPLRDNTATGYNIAYLDEINLSGTYRLGGHLLVRAGYSVLWLNQVSLAGDYLDFSIDPNAGTIVNHKGATLIHGINVGLEAQF